MPAPGYQAQQCDEHAPEAVEGGEAYAYFLNILADGLNGALVTELFSVGGEKCWLVKSRVRLRFVRTPDEYNALFETSPNLHYLYDGLHAIQHFQYF